MAEEDPVEQTIDALKAAKANTSCSELARHLHSLGFDIRDGRKPGHKLYFHDGLEDFYSSSYSCGHGRNPTVRPAYIQNVIQVLREHKTAISKHLGVNNDE